MNNNLQDDQLNFDIETENEILKLKISAELGGKFFIGENNDAPPEVLNSFLKKVYEVQKSITVSSPGNNFYELAGKPEIKRFSNPDDPEILTELRKLLKIFEEKNIIFDPSGVKGLYNKYNFFVDFVLLGKCYGLHHPGMITVYPLLEFAPHSWLDMYYEVGDYIDNSNEIISSKEFDPLEACFMNFTAKKNNNLSYSDIYDQRKEIQLIKLQIINVEERKEGADFFCGVVLRVQLNNSEIIFEGDLHFNLSRTSENKFEIINCKAL